VSTVPTPVFSDAWAAACAAALNEAAGFRRVAATWEGALLLVMAPDGPVGTERCVFLDLWRGECRVARAAAPAEAESARYVLVGSPASWRAVLAGQLAPLFALLSGKLRLAKGSLPELLPYVDMAKELVFAASSVETEFPPEL
jgi:putative sterol carrier protein